MANLTQIELPNGTTYDIEDTNGRKEENLQWGGPSQSDDVSPVGMALSCEHSSNRLAFINGAALTFEYSSDAGSTWTDYGYSATNKSSFCTKEYAVPVGRASASTEYTTSSRTRITLTAQNGTTGYVYTKPRKMLINVSTSGGMQVLVEVRTGTNYQSSGTWTTLGTYTLSGWSGWNDIPLVISTLGGGKTQTGNYWQLRLTFIMTSIHATNKTNANILSLRLFGSTTWTTPTGELSKTGHIYSFDMSQNATFPANLKMNADKQVAYMTATPTTGKVVVTDGTTGGIKASGYSVKDVLDLLLDRIYPVGSIYMSVTDSTKESVEARFGGTWVRFGEGRTLVGVKTSETEFNTVEKQGGEKTHALSTNEIPRHNHGIGLNQTGSAHFNGFWHLKLTTGTGIKNTNADETIGETATNFIGGGQSHNNLQPYITVYMYKRTA